METGRGTKQFQKYDDMGPYNKTSAGPNRDIKHQRFNSLNCTGGGSKLKIDDQTLIPHGQPFNRKKIHKIELPPSNMEKYDWHAPHIFSLMVSEGFGSYFMFDNY